VDDRRLDAELGALVKDRQDAQREDTREILEDGKPFTRRWGVPLMVVVLRITKLCVRCYAVVLAGDRAWKRARGLGGRSSAIRPGSVVCNFCVVGRGGGAPQVSARLR
jgi:hypothetical protein